MKLEIENRTGGHEIPENVTLVVPEKTTAYEILELAAKNNSAYKFEALGTSYGRMITSINNVQQNSSTGSYWSLYEDEKAAPDGVDLFIPKNNTCIIFKYERCGSSEEKSKSKPESDEGNTVS